MKNLKLLLAVPLLFVGLVLSASELSFETQRVKKTYDILPKNIRESIRTNSVFQSRYQLKSDEIIPNSHINVSYNSDNQLSAIGLYLTNESSIDKAHHDAYSFLENILLNFSLLPETSDMEKYAREMEISFFLNNKPIKPNFKQIVPFLQAVQSQKMTLGFEKSFFIANWSGVSDASYSIKFPAKINLIKGMDKVELENSFAKGLKNSLSSNQSKQIDISDLKKYKAELFIQHGEAFKSDNFRSDVFFEKVNDNFHPVFSEKYPIESLSNLFVCNLPIPIQTEVTSVFYGNNKKTESYPLDKICAYLQADNKVFFGLNSNKQTTIKATIIYYNDVYQYIHMLIIESEKSMIFNSGAKRLKSTLYTYIPYSEVKKQ